MKDDDRPEGKQYQPLCDEPAADDVVLRISKAVHDTTSLLRHWIGVGAYPPWDYAPDWLREGTTRNVAEMLAHRDGGEALWKRVLGTREKQRGKEEPRFCRLDFIPSYDLPIDAHRACAELRVTLVRAMATTEGLR